MWLPMLSDTQTYIFTNKNATFLKKDRYFMVLIHVRFWAFLGNSRDGQ